jgi:transposase InsO family protein
MRTDLPCPKNPESEPDCGYPMCAHAEFCEPTFTIDEIAEYIAGWTMGSFGEVDALAKQAASLALSQLRCDQDGIEIVTKLKRASKRGYNFIQ